MHSIIHNCMLSFPIWTNSQYWQHGLAADLYALTRLRCVDHLHWHISSKKTIHQINKSGFFVMLTKQSLNRGSGSTRYCFRGLGKVSDWTTHDDWRVMGDGMEKSIYQRCTNILMNTDGLNFISLYILNTCDKLCRQQRNATRQYGLEEDRPAWNYYVQVLSIEQLLRASLPEGAVSSMQTC